MGLLMEKPTQWNRLKEKIRFNITKITTKQIKQKIQMRTQAKKMKNFFKADTIKEELTKYGIFLEDNLKSTTWYQKKIN